MYRSRFVLLTQVGWPWPAHQAFQRRSCVLRVLVVSHALCGVICMWASVSSLGIDGAAAALKLSPRRRRRPYV